MTTDPFDIIRTALENVGHVSGSLEGSYYLEHEALAALDSIRDRYLPLEMLPKGRRIGLFNNLDETNPAFECVYDNEHGNMEECVRGDTPNAAFLAAVKAIGGGE